MFKSLTVKLAVRKVKNGKTFIKLKLLKIYYWDLQCTYMCGECDSYINGKCRQLSFKEYAKDLIKEYALLSHQLR